MPRLINVNTLQMKEFVEGEVPPYAILSHTWSTGEEVSFQEWQTITEFQDMENTLEPPSGTGADDASTPNYPADSYAAYQQRKVRTIKAKDGYQKIIKFCESSSVKRRKLKWAWVDTCCIDKSSSAELSEAINSMFRWYRDAEICIVYLADVPAIRGREDGKMRNEKFLTSRWFTRGWTLQELLAPYDLDFFDAGWNRIGNDIGLGHLLAQASGIDSRYLKSREEVARASVSVRMSWASRRKTTRVEDTAYCLLGIFSVNMPLLYGEGGYRAFVRLQEEIMKTSIDHTIFAWGYGMAVIGDPKLRDQSNYVRMLRFDNLLAPSPVYFTHGDCIQPVEEMRGEPPFQMTNKGLQIRLRLKEDKSIPGSYVALLNCHRVKPYYVGMESEFNWVAINLCLPDGHTGGVGRANTVARDGDVLRKYRSSNPFTIEDCDCGIMIESTVFVQRHLGGSGPHVFQARFTLQVTNQSEEPSRPWKLSRVLPQMNGLDLASEDPLKYRVHFNLEDNDFKNNMRFVYKFTGPTNFLIGIAARYRPKTPGHKLVHWSIHCQDLDCEPGRREWVALPIIEAVSADMSRPWISDLAATPSASWMHLVPPKKDGDRQGARSVSPRVATSKKPDAKELLAALEPFPYRVTLDSRPEEEPALSIIVSKPPAKSHFRDDLSDIPSFPPW